MNTFFTSDIHFSHFNGIKYCNRPYGNAREVFEPTITPERKNEIVHQMNEDIITGWNGVVGQYDFIYILGDVSFANAEQTERILQRLNGIKILIYGNHDKVIRNNKHLQTYFSETHELLERDFKIDDQKRVKIVMCHYAMRVWNKSHYNSWNLHGHSHGTLPPEGLQMDVGMDTNNMRPYSLADVARHMLSRQPKTNDHHVNQT